MSRCFLDANVLVYAFDASPVSGAKRDRALGILKVAKPGDLVVSTQVLAEFYTVATRKLRPALPEQEADDAVGYLATFPVVGADIVLVQAAITTSRTAQISLWDALIVESARVAGCERVLTEDLNDGGAISGVRIENPFSDVN